MAETFFVRLSDSGTATWGAFDPTGGLVGGLGRGTLQSVQPALAGRRCVALVNAVDVLTTDAALPAASQARLRQIVPFSLEESLADDLDQMVFAIGARLASGTTQVAAVAKDRMDAWLGELRAAGIVPNAVYSEADGIPDIPSTLVLIIEGDRIAGRKPGQAPFVFDGLDLRQVLALVRQRKPDEAELHHVRVFTDAAGRARFASELAALAGEFSSADVKILNDGVFPHFAATLAQRGGTNLLQGPYAPKSNWLALVKPWRLAAYLVVASMLLALVLQGAQLWQLERADAALTEAVASLCQRVVGESSTSACQREVAQRLGATAGSATEDFLSTLAAIAAVRAPELRIEALSYRNRVMDLQLMAPSVTALDEFARAVEQTRRFDVEIEAQNPVDTGTEGRLRIMGTNP
ncbi:MAG TPA: type II secretion system protein GspL [Gammaproteobacteria bacterium]|nr:type II secretion system protein GspL [Gammaproteobacteria bacterium]